MQFNVEIFQFFLLPIIIFASAYNLPDGAMRVFFVQLGRIVFFAVFVGQYPIVTPVRGPLKIELIYR